MKPILAYVHHRLAVVEQMAGGDFGEVAHAALRLGNDLLRDDHHVAGQQLDPGSDQLGEVIACIYLRDAFDSDQVKSLHTARRGYARSAGSSRSRAMASDV